MANVPGTLHQGNLRQVARARVAYLSARLERVFAIENGTSPQDWDVRQRYHRWPKRPSPILNAKDLSSRNDHKLFVKPTNGPTNVDGEEFLLQYHINSDRVVQLELPHPFRRRRDVLAFRQSHLAIHTSTKDDKNSNTCELGHRLADGLPVNYPWSIRGDTFIHLASHLILLQALLDFWGCKYEVTTGFSSLAGGETALDRVKEELLPRIFEVFLKKFPYRGWDKRVDGVGIKKETTSVPCF